MPSPGTSTAVAVGPGSLGHRATIAGRGRGIHHPLRVSAGLCHADTVAAANRKIAIHVINTGQEGNHIVAIFADSVGIVSGSVFMAAAAIPALASILTQIA